MRALGEGLEAQTGWDYKVKQLVHKKTELFLHLFSRPTLLGVQPAARAVLAPPWPELVISAGRRNELVALWIKARSPATRLVHIGRPWCHPGRFDLVVTTPQYRLEGFPNVLVNQLPLHRVDGELERGRAAWAEAFAHLCPPRTVLLVGGNSGAYVFDRQQAARLAQQTNALAKAAGGSLLVSTSARTPPVFVDALLTALDSPAVVYRWGDAGANPYYGLLAWGDRFIVTEDSVSMLAEALATGKPVAVFRIDALAGARGPWWANPGHYAWKPLTHRLAMAFAPARYHRDVRRLQQGLVDVGRSGWLDDAGTGTRTPPARAHVDVAAVCQRDLAATVARTLNLLQTG